MPKNSKRSAPDSSAKASDQSLHPPTSGESGRQVFVSYSRDDRSYVTKLAEWLESHGAKVWFDNDIDYGAKWETEILNQLDSSTVVLVIMSQAAQRSTWISREVERAKQQGRLILPLLLEQNAIIDCVADLQFENVVGGKMPGLRLCQKLPGFLVSERDIVNALTAEQRAIAERIFSAVRGGWRQGAEGPAVAALQTELTRVGLDPGPIDGVFGKKTRDAVREFQARRCHVAMVDGIPGPLTWMILANSDLGDLAPPTPPEQAQ
ncbi:TIR domain-containing protein [Desulfopila aestuarii]|uniref:Putative peptidoglycan binding domain-containing protein n=1 Tax=Desulfopila aestuarii DSM 18488 TaxID=1121416 RepID=A0A1M7XXK8_9BACT|nr:TIR domain-containing protein [Desulfopila aestuarii]SHO43699.1 Putative peptidoglycan binding domain-containing protein [Desulfopila aestuarii DSM 18488]